MNEPPLTADDLRRIGAERCAGAPCPRCGGLRCPGWEALPGGFDATALQRVGSLRDPSAESPTVEEYHPAGTHGWSPQAPIAPRFHPYNVSEVWQCGACRRAFLRYTEYGGYYTEARIRELDPALVADA